MGASQYFDQQPTASSKRQLVTLRLHDLRLELVTDRGVFARERVDPGTRVLLETAPPPPQGGALLDLGAGYGAVALALALRAPQTQVWAVEVNRRALELVRENAERAGVANVVAAQPEDVPGTLRFAALYSNPPVRIGKEALHTLLAGWLPRLDREASAYLVVQRNLGADSLARWLEGSGYAVERLASRKGYRVLAVTVDVV